MGINTKIKGKSTTFPLYYTSVAEHILKFKSTPFKINEPSNPTKHECLPSNSRGQAWENNSLTH